MVLLQTKKGFYSFFMHDKMFFVQAPTASNMVVWLVLFKYFSIMEDAFTTFIYCLKLLDICLEVLRFD
jgi:hypothetical protein